jgi:hypothetical protein
LYSGVFKTGLIAVVAEVQLICRQNILNGDSLMLTHPIAIAVWKKFAEAPPEYFEQNKALVEKAIAHVRNQCGDDEATILTNLLSVSEAV